MTFKVDYLVQFEITNYLDDEKDNDMYTGNDDVSIIVIE